MEEHADQAANFMLALFITGSLAIFVALFVALVPGEVILTPYTSIARAILPLITGLVIGLIVTAVGFAIAPVPGLSPKRHHSRRSPVRSSIPFHRLLGGMPARLS